MNNKAISWAAAAFETLGERLEISPGVLVNQLTGLSFNEEDASRIKQCLNASYKLNGDPDFE